MRHEWAHCTAYATARRRCPWAAVVCKAEAGFVAFESVDDYRAWKRNK